MSNTPRWPMDAIKMWDDGTGRLAYYKLAPGGGFDVYTRASVSAKYKKRKHVQTEDEANRELSKFMENI